MPRYKADNYEAAWSILHLPFLSPPSPPYPFPTVSSLHARNNVKLFAPLYVNFRKCAPSLLLSFLSLSSSTKIAPTVYHFANIAADMLLLAKRRAYLTSKNIARCFSRCFVLYEYKESIPIKFIIAHFFCWWFISSSRGYVKNLNNRFSCEREINRIPHFPSWSFKYYNHWRKFKENVCDRF